MVSNHYAHSPVKRPTAMELVNEAHELDGFLFSETDDLKTFFFWVLFEHVFVWVAGWHQISGVHGNTLSERLSHLQHLWIAGRRTKRGLYSTECVSSVSKPTSAPFLSQFMMSSSWFVNTTSSYNTSCITSGYFHRAKSLSRHQTGKTCPQEQINRTCKEQRQFLGNCGELLFKELFGRNLCIVQSCQYPRNL